MTVYKAILLNSSVQILLDGLVRGLGDLHHAIHGYDGIKLSSYTKANQGHQILILISMASVLLAPEWLLKKTVMILQRTLEEEDRS